MNHEEQRIWLIQQLLDEDSSYKSYTIPKDTNEQKDMLRALMNVREPKPISQEFLDVQDEYFKTHEKMDVSYKSKKVILTKGLGIIIFTVILFICSYIAGAKTFKDGFLLTFILMIWIGLYDTFFIDWVLFANLKMFRLEGTEHMDKEYHQKWFHLKGIFFPGIIFAIIPSLLVGLLCTLVK